MADMSPQNAGLLKWAGGTQQRVTLSISAYHLKIVQETIRDTVSQFCDLSNSHLYFSLSLSLSLQKTVNRFPIHEIASVSYVRDDDEHLVFIKAGQYTEPVCPVYVFGCSKQV